MSAVELIMDYRQIFDIRRILVGNKIVHHSDAVGASPVSNYIFILDLTHDLHKDNCKTRRETIKFWDLVRLILEVCRYSYWGVQTYINDLCQFDKMTCQNTTKKKNRLTWSTGWPSLKGRTNEICKFIMPLLCNPTWSSVAVDEGILSGTRRL